MDLSYHIFEGGAGGGSGLTKDKPPQLVWGGLLFLADAKSKATFLFFCLFWGGWGAKG